ncbi:MAG TPA: alpha/beta hydrolase [Solirubrobacterales bacterium]|nr:alpha/beta hydrolase [Solirubrobacterales bacterium]
METLETSAGTIAYDARGEGETIVMMPAGAHSRRDYDELRDQLPPRFRTIAIDWPGHGDSPPPDSPGHGDSRAAGYSAMRFADIAEEVVAQLAPQGAVVLGNSVGGFAAARLALRRPELVRGLVVVDGGGFAGRPLQARLFCALMARPWFLRRIYPSFSKQYMRPRSEADRRARAAAIATTRGEPGLSVVCGLWRSFASPEHDLRADAGDITTPTLLIWGRRDPVITLKVGRRAAELIPGSRLAVLDAGHVPHASDPAGFAAELVPFVEAAFAAAEPVTPAASGPDDAAGAVRP